MELLESNHELSQRSCYFEASRRELIVADPSKAPQSKPGNFNTGRNLPRQRKVANTERCSKLEITIQSKARLTRGVASSELMGKQTACSAQISVK